MLIEADIGGEGVEADIMSRLPGDCMDGSDWAQPGTGLYANWNVTRNDAGLADG